MNSMSQTDTVTRSIRTIPEYQGLLSWVSSVDHKQIGIMYLLGALFFFILGLIEALLIRTQLAVPENTFLSPALYNQIFTMHGTTMIFLVGMPLMLGLSVYFVPLMIGARDMAFPRLNAFGFWVFLFGGLLLYFSFMSGSAPLAGWFAYAPLNEKAYLFNSGQDYWIIALLLTGAGSIATAINVIVTVFTLRAPGMTLRRLPLFVWMTMINSFLIVFALPALNTALVMLLADRQLDALFFKSASGGLGPALAALLLVLWPSRGLYPDPTGVRGHLGGDPGVRPQADLRLWLFGRIDGGHRLFELRRLGPPHVRHRVGISRLLCLRRRQHAHRCADGHQDLQLDRHHVGRLDPFHDLDALRHRLFDPVHHRWPERRRLRRRAHRLAAHG